MTDPKQSAFLAEYKALCERHGLLLASEVFDPLTVERLGEGEDPLDHIGESGDEPWPDVQHVITLRDCKPMTPEELRSMQELQDAIDLMSSSYGLKTPDFSEAFPDKR